MKKRISKKKEFERRELLRQSKKQQLILGLSSIPPLVFTVVFIVIYAFKRFAIWLPATTSVLWLALGALFVYAQRSRWGFVTKKGVKSNENYSIVTIYNIVLVFLLGAFFLALTLYKVLR